MKLVHIYGATFRHKIKFFEDDKVTPLAVNVDDIKAVITDCDGCNTYLDLSLEATDNLGEFYMYSLDTRNLPVSDVYLKVYVSEGNQVISLLALRISVKY